MTPGRSSGSVTILSWKEGMHIMGNPLLPIERKGMTRREAADLLNGLASLIESYPTDGIVLSVNVEVATTGETPKKSPNRRKAK